jgi:phage terminase large subunit
MNNTLQILHTPVFTKNYNAFTNDKIRFIINQGGTRSSKTYSICQLIVHYALTNKNKVISIVRKTFPALSNSALVDFLDILIELELYDTYIDHNKTSNTFYFKNSGSSVKFFSADQPQKLRGRKHDLAFLNEANELTFDDFQQINMRTNGKIFIDYNPSDEYSWIYQLKDQKNAAFVHSTYKDNIFLQPELIKEIENFINVDDEYYQIYVLGITPTKKEKVFSKIHMNQMPKHLDFVYGMDFGWNDPSTIVKLAKDDTRIYIKEELYESYLTTDDLIRKMQTLGISKAHHIYADSARPDQIAAIKRAGYSISKSNKKIEEGLDFMKRFELHLDPVGMNTIKEFRQYSYKKVHNVITDQPVDYLNHSIDAARYAAISFKRSLAPKVYSF